MSSRGETEQLNEQPTYSVVDHSHKDVIHRPFFSYITFSWITPLLKKGSRAPLQEEDLPDLSEKDSAHQTAKPVLEDFWAQYKTYKSTEGSHAPSFTSALVRHFLFRYIVSLVLAGIAVASAIIQPLLISDVVNLLDPTADHSSPIIKTVWGYGLLYFALSVGTAFAAYNKEAMYLDFNVELRAIVIGAVYSKALKLSAKSQQEYGPGTVNSLISTDVLMISKFPKMLAASITCVAQIVLALYLLARLLGVTTILTAGLFVLLTVLTLQFIREFVKCQGQYMKHLDKRTKLLRELIYGMKSLKLEAAEKHEAARIEEPRNEQLKLLKTMTMWFLGVIFAIIIQQDFLPYVTIIGYTQFGGSINASTVFPILGLIAALGEPSGMLGGAVMGTLQAFPSLKRVSKFLLAEEILPHDVPERLALDAKTADLPAITIDRASFSWETTPDAKDLKETSKGSTKANKAGGKKGADKKGAEMQEREKETTSVNTVVVEAEQEAKGETAGSDKPKEAFKLSDITLEIPRGALVAIVGPVGSGKSSLLSAMVGSMRKVGSGSATLVGSIGYCAQDPWVVSGTLEENIRGFSADLSHADVSKAVEAACLTRDIEAFPHGLGTRVGEKGISLSGGQKARTQLCRAIASNADIFLLDDPLAALDAQVGKTIFDKTILGSMKGKTVVLVTHQLHLISKADMVVVLNGGKVAESGTFTELMNLPEGVLANMMKNYAVEGREDEVVQDEPDKEKDGGDLEEIEQALKKFEEQKLIAEDRQQGIVSGAVIWRYFKNGGLLLALFPLLWLPFAVFLAAFGNIIMVIWSDNSWGWSDSQYFQLYWIVGTVKLASNLMSVTCWYVLNYRASKAYHHNALTALVRAPLGWFDGQPAGRIINRMTVDVLQMDLTLSQDLVNLFDCGIMFFSAVVMVAYGTPYILIAFAILSIPSVWAFRFFQGSYRELKRLSSILKSPLSAHCSETFYGIPSIKAYRWEASFVARQEHTTDLASKALLLMDSAKLWISLRMALFTSIIVLTGLILAEVGVVEGSAAGLMLVGLINLASLLNIVLLMISMTEASFNAVERMDYYAGKLPMERQVGTVKVSDAWPQSGAIDIKDLEIRYDSTAAPVLQDLSVSIRAGEKVAVCGRSGAGKSTLMLALFRIVEAYKGSIHVDGQDISELDLDTLRERLQIIPQEPILFSGTFRSNIDRRGKRTDQEIWKALEMAGMKEYISGLPSQLDAEVTEGGANLSSGQRQLIVLSKAILSNAKIIIMDEATASVDHEADERIQEMVSSHFKHCTVVSIAHRLNTIAGFDKVLVLKDGRFVEFDTPHVLLANPESLFADLVEATGQANAALIRDIAARHEAEKNVTEV
ncbi:P-loop containing nucleoside triphosphate hydrolase protein [Fimicolochytrium jonesii]|uniref:P-loop containing nucleoside triphosphate hydrolase protein n=1 Tax=Fimicolochytrium jonesii TaxID=1396493 RepID=UPI0022FE53F6|nr:P-loop containing nucleoside triphosphate hydrolase protein [Fimicolochytrium jonesii]KAI8817512.1 P-loop containing nucleoside triphosphate hydrolase protein [Fimicolochytrium jonesii]